MVHKSVENESGRAQAVSMAYAYGREAHKMAGYGELPPSFVFIKGLAFTEHSMYWQPLQKDLGPFIR